MLTPCRSKKNRRGFTLIELLVAVLILGLTLGALLGAFVIGKAAATKAKHHMEAIHHAQAAMEQYIHDGITSYTIGTGDIASLDGACAIGTSAFATDITKVTVTVSWTERTMTGDITVSEQLITLINQ